MFTDTTGQPRTAPHMAIWIGVALAIVFGLHIAGFSFVGTLSGGLGR